MVMDILMNGLKRQREEGFLIFHLWFKQYQRLQVKIQLSYLKGLMYSLKRSLSQEQRLNMKSMLRTINIEARTMIDLTVKQMIPSIIAYATELGNSINTIKAACDKADISTQEDMLIELSSLLKESKRALTELQRVTEEAAKIEDSKEKAFYYYQEVTTAMATLRAPIDKLEMIVDKEYWPMPSYGDLIFEV